jgi:hypothetical protein
VIWSISLPVNSRLPRGFGIAVSQPASIPIVKTIAFMPKRLPILALNPTTLTSSGYAVRVIGASERSHVPHVKRKKKF